MFVELRIAGMLINRQETPAWDKLVPIAIINNPMLNGIGLKNDD